MSNTIESKDIMKKVELLTTSLTDLEEVTGKPAKIRELENILFSTGFELIEKPTYGTRYKFNTQTRMEVIVDYLPKTDEIQVYVHCYKFEPILCEQYNIDQIVNYISECIYNTRQRIKEIGTNEVQHGQFILLPNNL